MVEEKSVAPDFSLVGSDGKSHSLSEFKGKYLILYFYPKDNTPGCTIEANDFNNNLEKIEQLGAKVVGVSKDGLESHGKFRDKYNLSFLLLSDPESKVIKAYGAYGDRGIFGMGTLRNTYVIDKNGKIAKIYSKVNPRGHAKEIVEFLEAGAR